MGQRAGMSPEDLASARVPKCRARSDRVLRWTQRLRAQEKLAKSSPVSCCATAVCCCATALLVVNGFQTCGISPVGMWNAGNRP